MSSYDPGNWNALREMNEAVKRLPPISKECAPPPADALTAMVKEEEKGLAEAPSSGQPAPYRRPSP